MDFWNWLWIVAFFVMLFGGWKLFTDMGRRALSRHLSEKAEPVKSAARVKTLAEVHKDEQAEWQKTFLELLQKDCKHHFDGGLWDDWWKCVHCEFEQEWNYEIGCSCQSQSDYAISLAAPTRVLTRRSRYCTIHGRDSATQPRRELNKYSEGGYLGLHAPKISHNPFTHFD